MRKMKQLFIILIMVVIAFMISNDKVEAKKLSMIIKTGSRCSYEI